MKRLVKNVKKLASHDDAYIDPNNYSNDSIYDSDIPCTSYEEDQHKVKHYRNERKYDRDGKGKYFRPLSNFELGLYFNHLL